LISFLSGYGNNPLKSDFLVAITVVYLTIKSRLDSAGESLT